MKYIKMKIHYNQIKNKAALFLHQFYNSIEEHPAFPILLHEIVNYLHYQIEFTSLPDYLVAYTDMVEKKIYLSSSLDDSEQINIRGRLHFTIAHEIAHIVLHEKMYLEKLAFCAKEENWELMHKLTENEKLEKEADIFASHIILPRNLIKKEMTDYFGNCRLYFSNIYLLPEISSAILAYLKEKTNASENAIIIALRDIHIIRN